MVVVILLAVTILGLIGYLVAGMDGLVNGATWGFVLGLVSVPFFAFLVLAKYWGDYAGRYGEWWVKKETEGEE